ncbi:predicted protein [Histoplasma capsulatum H143]|uniref:Uncharacterized protein n=1 Tax=Ajellomyces capsulatus (strain H143) TaxID=544712 RepID=C6HCM1_AJECH|nr:predicted protein [Histoplasma capsulatum H143]
MDATPQRGQEKEWRRVGGRGVWEGVGFLEGELLLEIRQTNKQKERTRRHSPTSGDGESEDEETRNAERSDDARERRGTGLREWEKERWRTEGAEEAAAEADKSEKS